MQNSFSFFVIKPEPSRCKRSMKLYSGSSKNEWIRLHASISYETKAIRKISSMKSILSIYIKIYLPSVVYHHQLQKYCYYWNITLNYCFICKINIKSNLTRKLPLYRLDLSHLLFSVFPSNCNIWYGLLYFVAALLETAFHAQIFYWF